MMIFWSFLKSPFDLRDLDSFRDGSVSGGEACTRSGQGNGWISLSLGFESGERPYVPTSVH